MNVDFDEKRKREDDAIQDAMGKTMTFEEYLKNDKDYRREMENAKKRKPGEFKSKAF